MIIHIPISVGEFIDRLTILELKFDHATDAVTKKAIQDQISQYKAAAPVSEMLKSLGPLRDDLAAVNAQLWVIEDDLRLKEIREEFDEDFIALARSVYRLNDRRAAIKRQMDTQVGSDFSDPKIYRAAEPNK